MKTAIFSDIHGNLPALEIAIKNTKSVDRYIVLGDVVNYGPWNNECVQLLETLPNCIKILGNHDVNFINEKNPIKTELSKNFFFKCIKNFSQKIYLKKYLYEFRDNNFIFKHTINNKYIFSDTKIIIDSNYFIGHSHQAYLIKNNNFILANPGSIGQNRKYINEINFLIHDSESENIELKSIIYNVDLVINEMRNNKFSDLCINYYKNKSRR
tara:strand:- start:1849 stop:2484 length:636 start_codon:yes stop_codon:yes gene_type:complete